MAVGLLSLLGNVAQAANISLGVAASSAIVFEMTDGSTQDLSSDGLSMSFSDGSLVANYSGGVFQMPTSKIAKFYFKDSNTGVVGDLLLADTEVAVYNLTGIYLGTFENPQAAQSTLPAGFYIFKSADKSLKLRVK